MKVTIHLGNLDCCSSSPIICCTKAVLSIWHLFSVIPNLMIKVKLLSSTTSIYWLWNNGSPLFSLHCQFSSVFFLLLLSCRPVLTLLVWGLFPCTQSPYSLSFLIWRMYIISDRKKCWVYDTTKVFRLPVDTFVYKQVL